MAKNANIKINVDSSSAQKSMKDLNKEVKNTVKTFGDLEEEQDRLLQQLRQTEVGTEEFKRLSKELNNVKSQVKDIELGFEGLDLEQRFTAYTDAIGGLAGGFAAVEGAIAIAGVESEEFEQTLLKVNGAMALAMGVKDISTMIAALKKLNIGTKIYTVTQKALNVVMRANPIGIIITAITALIAIIGTLMIPLNAMKNAFFAITDAIGLTDTAAEEHAKKQEERAKAERKQHEARVARIKREKDLLIDRYDKEIELAQAAGDETDKLEKRKIKALIRNQEEYIAELEKRAKQLRGAEREMAKGAILVQKQKLNDLLHDEKVFNLTQRKERLDAAKKNIEEDKKQRDAAIAAQKKANEEKKKEEADFQKWQDEQDDIFLSNLENSIDKEIELKRAKAETDRKLDEETTRLSMENLLKEEEARLAALEKEKQDKLDQIEFEKNLRDARLDIAMSTTQGLQQLTNILINDGAKAEKAQKALALAQIGIDTGKAISSLIAMSQANPLNAVTAGAAGIAQYAAGIVQILTNIAQAKALIMNPSSGGGVGATGGGRAAIGSVTSNITGAGQTPNTIIRPDGENMPQRVYVTETDISDTQNRVRVLEQQSTIG